MRCTTDPLKVLRHRVAFLQDPSKIDESNREVWCNLHITPALKGIVVEVVTHWVRKECLHLGLARVHVAPNQKMCSLINAVDSAKEHFNKEKGLEAAH